MTESESPREDRDARSLSRHRAQGMTSKLARCALAAVIAGLGFTPPVAAEEPAIVLHDVRNLEPAPAANTIEFYVNPSVKAAPKGVFYFREPVAMRRKQDYLVQSYFDPAASSADHVSGMLQFEQAVVSNALALYGYEPEELRRFLYSDRENAIGVLFIALQGALAKKQRSEVEQEAVDWLRAEVQRKRVSAAEIARQQYVIWERDPCGYARVKPRELAYDGPGPVCNGGGRLSILLTTADPPSYDALQEYGARQAHSLYNPDKVAFMQLLETQMARSIAALSTATATTGLTAIGVPLGLSIYYGSITQGGYLFAGPLAAVVSLSVVIAITEGVSVVEKDALPGKLADAVVRARTSAPRISELLTREGIAESLSALADATRLDAATQRQLDTWNDENSLHHLLRGADYQAFERRYRQLASRGFWLVDLETFVDASGSRRWDGLFLPGTTRTVVLREESGLDFDQKSRALNAQGFSLVDIETYEDDGQRKWAGIWEASREPSLLVRESSLAAFEAQIAANRAQGMRLHDVETYLVRGQRNWAGVFVRGSGPEAFVGDASLAAFKIQQLRWSDRQLVDVETYEEGGTQRWVGVWFAPSSGFAKTTLNTPAAELPDGWSKDGKQIVEYDSYLDGAQRKSIAIWATR